MFFEQEHPPGREAQVDFTHCGELGVTVGGEPFVNRQDLWASRRQGH